MDHLKFLSLAGSKKTPAKAAAARVNGRKGGRPKGAKDAKPRVRTKKP